MYNCQTLHLPGSIFPNEQVAFYEDNLFPKKREKCMQLFFQYFCKIINMYGFFGARSEYG